MGLKLVLGNAAETLLSPSVSLSVKPADGSNFQETFFSVSNPSNVQVWHKFHYIYIWNIIIGVKKYTLVSHLCLLRAMETNKSSGSRNKVFIHTSPFGAVCCWRCCSGHFPLFACSCPHQLGIIQMYKWVRNFFWFSHVSLKHDMLHSQYTLWYLT